MAKGDLTFQIDKADYERMMRWLSELDEVDQKSVIQNALKTGAKSLQDAGKANLASRNKSITGKLKKSFGVRVVKKQSYALVGFKRPGGAAAHLIDRGTKKRYTRQGYYRGSVSKGTPNKGSMFWTDAVETKGPEALNRIMDAIYASLEEITRRNQK